MAMNRNTDELIDDMAACTLSGGVSAFLIGDNEMARLVVEWRDMKEKAVSAELAFEKGRLTGIKQAGQSLGLTV